MKTTYEAPKMEKLGSFEDLTLNTSNGADLDFGFVVGQPLADQPVS